MLLLLKKYNLPKIIENKTAGESVRIWIAACALSEVYSIAMLLLNSRPTTNNITSSNICIRFSIEALI
jgi:chemotaxis methyl-accepting protein methylase